MCSPTENAEWFGATIGGLGLTGLILWAEIALKRIDNPAMAVETIRYGQLEDFFELSQESDQKYEYTVAWVDSMAKGSHLGRGLFIRGNHAAPDAAPVDAPRRRVSIPVNLPVNLITRMSARLFNNLHYRIQLRTRSIRVRALRALLFPAGRNSALEQTLRATGLSPVPVCGAGRRRSKCPAGDHRPRGARRDRLVFRGAKVFGDRRPPVCCLPRPGVTVALDFYHHGETTLRLLDYFDEVVLSVGGAVNPYKDARMSGTASGAIFPGGRIGKFSGPQIQLQPVETCHGR